MLTTIETLCRQLTQELVNSMYENQIHVSIDFEAQIMAYDNTTLVVYLLKTKNSKDLGPKILCVFSKYLAEKYPHIRFRFHGRPTQNGYYEITTLMPANTMLSQSEANATEIQRLLNDMGELLKQGVIKTILSYRPNAIFELLLNSSTKNGIACFAFHINYKEQNEIFWSAVHEQFTAFVAQKFSHYSIRGNFGDNNEFIYEVFIPIES